MTMKSSPPTCSTTIRGLMDGSATLGQVAGALAAPLLLTLLLAPLTLFLYRRQ